MTTGALIFAFNNECTDYVSMAAWTAQRIRRFLDIPVAVVTNDPKHKDISVFDKVVVAKAEAGGNRYFDDYDASVTWFNASRVDAYDLSPWDCTLLLDADYVIDSSNLKVVLKSSQDFMCFRDAFDLAAPINSDGLLNTFGRYKFPMWWATVIKFNKTVQSQYIFDCMKMIKKNWKHYCDLYGIERGSYRNDYALSIAIGIVSGHTLKIDAIPWSMPSVLPEDDLRTNGSQWLINYQDSQNKRRQFYMTGMDFHAMGKRHLEAVIANQR